MAVRDSVSWQDRRDTRWIAGVLVVAGIVVLQWFVTIPAIRHIWVGGASESWSSVDGSIRQIEQAKKSKFVKYVRYSFAIDFQVEGEAYACTSYNADAWGGAAIATPRWRAAKPGDVLRVYYDPTRPERSCINPGVELSAWLVLPFAFAPILILVVAVIRNGWRSS